MYSGLVLVFRLAAPFHKPGLHGAAYPWCGVPSLCRINEKSSSLLAVFRRPALPWPRGSKDSTSRIHERRTQPHPYLTIPPVSLLANLSPHASCRPHTSGPELVRSTSCIPNSVALALGYIRWVGSPAFPRLSFDSTSSLNTSISPPDTQVLYTQITRRLTQYHRHLSAPLFLHDT